MQRAGGLKRMLWMVLEFIVLLLTHAVVGIYSSALKYSKKTTYVIWGVWIVLQTLFLWLAESVLTNAGLQFFMGFALALIGQYVIFFLTTKGRIAQRLFTILTYSIFFCIAMTLFTVVKGSIGYMPFLSVLIQAALLAVVVSYFLLYVCPLCRKAAKNITNGWKLLIFVNVVFLITIILSTIFPVKLTSFKDAACITYIFLSISIMAVYPVIFSNVNSMSEAAEKRETERQNKLLLAQIEVEQVQLAADSQARHDRRHHNLVMLEFANNNDVGSVREYLKNLLKREEETSGKAQYCENLTMNTVLTVYERQAKAKDVFVNVSASVSRDIDVSPQDLVIVVANLFENAINATSKIKDKERRIHISIKESMKRLVIKIENPCENGLAFDENCFGVGIRSVITVANKYDGMYDFTAENGRFSAKIILNLR
jgi:signal transduction histidine kinase